VPDSVLPVSEGAPAHPEPDTAFHTTAPAQIESDWSANTWGSSDRAPRPVTDAQRARIRLQGLEQDREHASHVELDVAARDTRAGIAATLGRGTSGVLPRPVPSRHIPETSVIGKGSRLFHTGVPIPVVSTRACRHPCSESLL